MMRLDTGTNLDATWSLQRDVTIIDFIWLLVVLLTFNVAHDESNHF